MLFHHRDPATKKFGISMAGSIQAWETIKEELDKCDLLCSNCHAELHDAERNVPDSSEVERRFVKSDVGGSNPSLAAKNDDLPLKTL